MKVFSPAVLAVLAGGLCPVVTMIRFDFPSGTIGLNNSNVNFTFGGLEYKGAGEFGSISPIVDGGGEFGGIRMELAAFDPTYLSLALDEIGQVQNTPIEIRSAILDPVTYQILDAPLDWKGRADVMSTAETPTEGRVGLTGESKGVDLLRGNPSVYNDGDQQSRFPGDKYYRYVNSQSDKPIIWPMRAWYFK